MEFKVRIHILNIKIFSLTQKELLEQMAEGVLYTPNLDHLIKLQYDREFYDIYQQAEWIVCDSQILYLVSKLLKRSLPMAIRNRKNNGEYKQESREANSGRCSFTLLRFREERTGV